MNEVRDSISWLDFAINSPKAIPLKVLVDRGQTIQRFLMKDVEEETFKALNCNNCWWCVTDGWVRMRTPYL
jgi:hypothetical protein